jgi:hypothetical protein
MNPNTSMPNAESVRFKGIYCFLPMEERDDPTCSTDECLPYSMQGVKVCTVTDFQDTETYVFKGKQQLVCCDEMSTTG